MWYSWSRTGSEDTTNLGGPRASWRIRAGIGRLRHFILVLCFLSKNSHVCGHFRAVNSLASPSIVPATWLGASSPLPTAPARLSPAPSPHSSLLPLAPCPLPISVFVCFECFVV